MSRVITRSEWGAKYGRGYATAGAKLHLYIHHAAGKAPKPTLEAESARVRQYEEQHARTLTPTNPRIGYTALFGQSGYIFEGCGLGFIGAHTAHRNSSGWGVCFLLDGRVERPSDAAVESFLWWREQAIGAKHLAERFDTQGHRDVVNTTCPGDIVYGMLVTGTYHVGVPSVAESVAAMPSLRRGKGGRNAPADITSAVLVAQQRMVELGYMTPAALATGPGTFGPATDRATRRFQQAMGLKVDGIIGPKTWKVLLR